MYHMHKGLSLNNQIYMYISKTITIEHKNILTIVPVQNVSIKLKLEIIKHKQIT